MGDTHHDPSDHSRTTQPHAGIVMKDNFFWPGLILFVVATFGLITTVAAAAVRTQRVDHVDGAHRGARSDRRIDVVHRGASSRHPHR